MTIDATVEKTEAAGVVDELVARVAALGDAQSGPGPPVVVVIAEQRVGLGPESVLVGRSAEMFGIDHPKVSRCHVGVQLVDGVLIASDLESRNGTWVVRGGERLPLTPMAVLWPGDRLVTLDDVELVRIPELDAAELDDAELDDPVLDDAELDDPELDADPTGVS